MTINTIAKIANESYRKKFNRKENINGYEYIESLSNDKLAVYRKNNEYILSSRGTSFDPSRRNDDIAADLAILKGTEKHSQIFQTRIKNIENIIRQIKSNNPDSKIELTGHSLGGQTSIQAMNNKFINDNVTKVITFNPGTSPLSKFTGDSSKIENHIVKGDPISQFKVPGEKIEYSSKRKVTPINLGINLFTSGFTQKQLNGIANNHSMNLFITPGEISVKRGEKTIIKKIEEIQEVSTSIKGALKTVKTIGAASQKFKKLARGGRAVVKGVKSLQKLEVVAAAESTNPILDAILLIDWGVNKVQRAKQAKELLENLGDRADLEEHNKQPYLTRSVRVELYGEFLAAAKEALEEEEPTSDKYKKAKFYLSHPGVFWFKTRNFADNSSLASRAEIIGLEIGSSKRFNEFLGQTSLSDLELTQPKVITQEELDAENKKIMDRDRNQILESRDSLSPLQNRRDYNGHKNILEISSEVDSQFLKGHPDFEFSKNVLGLGINVSRERQKRFQELYRRGIVRRPGTL